MPKKPAARPAQAKARSLAALALVALLGGACPGRVGSAQESPDAAFAAGDFAAAGRGYRDLLAAHPSDQNAGIGLASVELFSNDLASARVRLESILSRDPTNERVLHLMHDLSLRTGTSGDFRVKINGSEAAVPFVTTDPLPVLAVRVNDKLNGLFFIDTGAPDIVLDPDFASELGIAATPGEVGVFAGGKRAAVDHAKIDSIVLGNARVENVPATVLTSRSFPQLGGRHLDGVIGTGLLDRFLSTIDYAHGRLELRLRNNSKAFEESAARRGAAAIPIWLVGDHFIFARGHINDGPVGLFNVDTGLAGGGVSASQETLREAHVFLDRAHETQGMGGGGPVTIVPFDATVTLGTTTVAGVQGLFTPEGTPYGMFPFHVSGTVSHGFFRRFAVTLDFDAMRLVLE
jgi:hypothetical protein